MFSFKVLLFYFAIKGALCDILNDVALDKLSTQFVSTVNFVFEVNESKPIQLDVSFNLYTTRNPQIPQILIPEYPSLLKLTNFDPQIKTYVITHGFTDHKDREIISNLRIVLVNSEEANVIVVDWRRLAGLFYFHAADSAISVGRHLGEFLQFLETKHLDLAQVHLIGHSLGAQISGIAGNLVGGRVGRITGLDPAGPYFEFLYVRDLPESLDKSDAKFVDVIHTNGGEFGAMNPIGHADFYPNKGISPQPGCTDILTVVSCSHIRSILYYTESVNWKIAFKSLNCVISDEDGSNFKCFDENPANMGHHLTHEARGLYYLETNPDPPFAKG